MIWKEISGYEGLYEVSDTGLVRSLWYGKKRILSPAKNGFGYLHVSLCKDGKTKSMLVHRLVAEAFVPNPNNLETVNHKDEVKTNNKVNNLEWMTLADNNCYGTHVLRVGLAHSKPVLQLDKSGNVVKQFPSTQEAARQTGIPSGSICKVCNGNRKTAGGFIWKYA
jgi:hypothetical protein